jgi:hypothetical protein
MQVRQLLTPVAAAAFVLSAGSAQAITFYTDASAFAAVALNPAVDTFNGIAPFTSIPLPLTRSVGDYGYSISAPEGLFTVGEAGDTWMSTNALADVLNITNLTGGVQSLGGFIFGTDFDGEVVPSSVTLTVTAIGGAVDSLTIASNSATTFLGAVSFAGIQSVSLSISDQYVTLNNLTIAAAIPEPGTYALMLGGLGMVGWLARRRRTV